MKSLEVSEEKANQRVEEFKRQLKALTVKLKEAENRAEYAEKTVKKLQKEVDRLEGRFFGSFPKLFRVFRLSELRLKETTIIKSFHATDHFVSINYFLSRIQRRLSLKFS